MPQPPDEEILKKLDEVEWDSFRPQMIAYAAWLAENHYAWRGQDTEIKGQQLTDLVDNIIVKLYSGIRVWPIDRVPSLKTWFKKTVQSEMYALFTSKAATQEHEFESNEEAADSEGDAIAFQASGNGPFDYAIGNPEDVLINKEHREEIEAALYHAADENPELEALVLGMMELEECKPQHLADYLNVPVEDINNRLRRLRARNPRIKKELGIDDE